MKFTLGLTLKNFYIACCITCCVVIGEDAIAQSSDCADRVIIAPPPVSDWNLGNWIGDEVARSVAQVETGRCWFVQKFDESSAAFDVVGATTAFARKPSNLNSRQVGYLRQTHSATHILFPGVPTSDGKLVTRLFKITEHDNLIYVRSYQLAFDPDELNSHRSKPLVRLMSSIAPNAIQMGYTQTDVYFSTDTHFTDRKIHRRGVFPPLISAFAVSRVEHPRAYRLFDVAGTIFPGQYFFGINQENSYKKDTTSPGAENYPEELSLQIETYGACGSANAQGALFTPAGTTYIGVGFGPCFLWMQKKEREPIWYGKTAVRLFFGHRVFATDNLYFAVEWDSLLFNQSLYKSQYAKAGQIERAGFSAGWYIENTEKLATEFWSLFN